MSTIKTPKPATQTIATSAPITATESVSALRRSLGRSDLRRFAGIYLPQYFKDDPSVMHTELYKLLEDATATRGARVAIAAPRGHAKSTIATLAYILWCICYHLEDYIVLVSNTADQACDALSHLKKELEDNPLLLKDFPECCEAPRPGPPRWRKDEIITPSGIKISALGAGSKIRGRKNRHSRPGLIVLDDVENESDVRSPDQRLQLSEWFNKAVAKAGAGNTNIVVVGTILHFDSLLAILTDPNKSPGWTGKIYRAVIEWSPRTELWQAWENLYNGLEEDDQGATGPAGAQRYFDARTADMLDGTRVLWPNRESYRDLMELRIRDGRASFDCEKQNSPVDPTTCYFRESDLIYWDDQYGSAEDLLKMLGERGRVYGACDPSLGKLGKNRDDTAIITLVVDSKTGVKYILDADIARRKPDQIIEQVIALHRIRRFIHFGFETTQFQEFLADELRRRSGVAGVDVPVKNIKHVTDKLGRIQKLQAFVTAGQIRFSRRHVALLEQLRQFPNAAHDDGPDALEMAVETAMAPEVGISILSHATPGPHGSHLEYDPATGRYFEWNRVNSYDDLWRLGHDADRQNWRWP
jgi:predicted phage terminase large subunit-like protein